MRRKLLILTGCLLALASISGTASAVQYEIRDLGSLGGGYSIGTAVNDFGQVAGWSFNAAGNSQAFIWRDGVMSGLAYPPGDFDSAAYGINNLGQVVGYSCGGFRGTSERGGMERRVS